MLASFAIITALMVLYATTALLLNRWSISMPLIFVLVGYLMSPAGIRLLSLSPDAEVVKQVTEITLALVLFADASTLNLRQVRADIRLPTRLLTIGLLLMIGLGALVAFGLLPEQGAAAALLLAAIVAPTDAALGLPIFTNRNVPVRIRRALNVESGLNDGIVTPFVTLFLALALGTRHGSESSWLVSALSEMGRGLLVGAGIGGATAWLVSQTTRRGWTAGGAEQLAIVGVALTAYFGSLALGGNGFIAAFVAGLVFGSATQSRFAEPTEFSETLGTLLSVLVWGLFGATLVSEVVGGAGGWRAVTYAVLSLTVVRMLSVALAWLGTGLRRDTIALMGWFGPRGLASVVFTLLALVTFEEAGQPAERLLATATWTILLSVVAHGLSAGPLAAWYARRLATAPGSPIELMDLPELHARHRVHYGPPRRLPSHTNHPNA